MFVYRKKRTKCEKITLKEYKILTKILQQEKRYGMKRLLAEFPDRHWPLRTVKCLQRKIDDTAERSTDNLPVEENEKLSLNKNAV